MSEDHSKAHAAAAKPHKPYPFSVDGTPYTWPAALITGAQVKSTAGVDPAFGLYLEGHGNEPDAPVGDGDTVDLSQPGREKFYAAPPATYGLPAAVER